MARSRPCTALVAMIAVLASGLYVPVHYHGHGDADESHVHQIVHRHHGRLHIHVHHHGPDCHSDRERAGGDCGDDHCEDDHAPELWLSSMKDDGWREGLVACSGDLLVQQAWESGSSWMAGYGCASGRSPPVHSLRSSHLSAMRSVILRL